MTPSEQIDRLHDLRRRRVDASGAARERAGVQLAAARAALSAAEAAYAACRSAPQGDLGLAAEGGPAHPRDRLRLVTEALAARRARLVQAHADCLRARVDVTMAEADAERARTGHDMAQRRLGATERMATRARREAGRAEEAREDEAALDGFNARRGAAAGEAP